MDTKKNDSKFKNLSHGEKILYYIKSMQKTMNTCENIKLKRKNKIAFLQMMRKKYIQLYEKSPTLFEKVIEEGNRFDNKRLIIMLGLGDKVRNKEITFHDASVHIGQKYFDEYVKPHVADRDK